jgi:hypothetical protein
LPHEIFSKIDLVPKPSPFYDAGGREKTGGNPVKSHDASAPTRPFAAARWKPLMDRGQWKSIDPKGAVVMLTHFTPSGVEQFEPCFSVPPQPDRERRQRILAAFGLPSSRTPGRQANLRVDEQTLARYYDYLVGRLELPFAAYYPPPDKHGGSSHLPAPDRCEVIELLDPRTDLCDEIDGLYCRTRKGKFVVNLPLVELTVLPPSGNAELLSDYEYWFWHWRE